MGGGGDDGGGLLGEGALGGRVPGRVEGREVLAGWGGGGRFVWGGVRKWCTELGLLAMWLGGLVACEGMPEGGGLEMGGRAVVRREE